MKNKVVFFGTPWIAKECLTELYQRDDVEILAVVCQPDRQKNRKKEIVYSEVKQFALDHQIKIFQPEKIKDITEDLRVLNADIFITCAYGQFVNDEILNLPKYKAVNVHASLLPKLRGGAPIHWAIINQYKETGITLMYMVKKMDAGNIIFQEAIKIDNKETYASLLVKLAQLARKMLSEHFAALVKDDVKSIVQNEDEVTLGFNITKEQEILNFNQPASNIEAMIRGLNNKPLAKLIYDDIVYKIYEAETSNIKSIVQPGTILSISDKGLEISTIDFNIFITKIQAPNKNPVTIKQLINGHHPFKINTLISK